LRIANSVQFSAGDENGPSGEPAVLQTRLVWTTNVVDDASTFRLTRNVVADEHKVTNFRQLGV